MSLLDKNVDIRMRERDTMVALGFHLDSAGDYWKKSTNELYTLTISRIPDHYFYQIHLIIPGGYSICVERGKEPTLSEVLNLTEKYWK